jgi:integrase
MRVFVGRDSTTGKRKFVIETFERKKDADAKARKLEGMKDKGVLVTPSKDPVAKYLRRWLKDVMHGRVRARTWNDYDGILSRYIEKPPEGAPPIGSVRMDRLTPEGIQSLYGWLQTEQGLAPATIRRLHAVLRQGLEYATRTGALGRNPADLVVLPRHERHEVKAMLPEEATKFLEAAKADRYAALWFVLLLGGLRPSEALALAWSDVDLETGKVRVQRTLVRRGVRKRGEKAEPDGTAWRLVEPKTNRARRTVPLPAFVATALREHKRKQAEERLKLGAEYQGHGFVFATPFGAPLDLANIGDRNFRRVMAGAGLGTWGPEPLKGARGPRGHRRFDPKYRLYDLRHSCATLLLRAGVNPKVASERLGHASVAFTMDVYAAYLPDMQEEAAEKLGAMLGGAHA